MKKGISPLIASVLLIAFAIAVATVYSGWITSMTKTTTGEVEEHSQKQVECSYGGIALDDLEYNTTTGNITGIIENTDIIELGGINLEIFYTNASKEKKTLSYELSPGESNVFNVITGSNYDKVRVFTNCSNVYDQITSGDITQVS